MLYNQISKSGQIVTGTNPKAFEPNTIKDIIFDALNLKDYSFKWKKKTSQPSHGILYDGVNSIDLYIYAWNITPAYRTNQSEKRIQLPATVNNIGIDRPITSTEKAIIVGVYNSPTGEPLFAAWDTTVNRGHGQKSCYVLIEDVAKAITNGIYSTKDKNGAPIYTMTSQFLADYISLLSASNTLTVSSASTTLRKKVESASLPKQKKRTIKKTQDILDSINSLTAVEREIICKSRVGQGLFKDLLLEKYSCKCALCNITTQRLLIASHIKEWSESNDDEKLDVNNGLLLCAHHDALFDKHLISFNDDGSLVISPLLSEAEKTTLSLSEIPILTITAEMIPYLVHHRSKLKK